MLSGKCHMAATWSDLAEFCKGPPDVRPPIVRCIGLHRSTQHSSAPNLAADPPAGGVAEDLSASLSGGCPSFFKEDDKTFYQASGLLQRAEGTPAAAERAHLVREALRLMLKVAHSSTACILVVGRTVSCSMLAASD